MSLGFFNNIHVHGGGVLHFHAKAMRINSFAA